MKRLMLTIALLFAFASASGPAMANAMVSGHFWTVATVVDGWCVESSVHRDAAPIFKPCAKKINGQTLPCSQCLAVLPTVGVGCPAALPAQSYDLATEPLSPLDSGESMFRPPRLLVGA
jgi:hypothetical protein